MERVPVAADLLVACWNGASDNFKGFGQVRAPRAPSIPRRTS